jgi:hypothetical protein
MEGQRMKFDPTETDLLRLADLAKEHGFTYIKVGTRYYFDTEIKGPFQDGFIYSAHGLREALAFAEGFDRAKTRELTQQ